MTRVELTALRPTHPLGWLAALGALKVVQEPGARLSWSQSPTPHAVLHVQTSEHELFEGLAQAWRAQAEHRALFTLNVEGHARPFPPRDRHRPRDPGPRGMNDPVKMTPEEYADYAVAAQVCGHDAVAWLRALATDVTIEDDRLPAIASLTDFYLLSRQQRLAQQFDALHEWVVRKDPVAALRQAAVGWRRVPLKGGMNWDIDGNRNAAESPTGKPQTLVTPGITWLAMMALPLFPVTAALQGTRTRPCTRSWVRYRVGRRVRTALIMPTWRVPLAEAAIEVLLDHPLLNVEPEASEGGVRLIGSRAQLDALGVLDVYAAGIVYREVGGQTEAYVGKASALPTGGRSERGSA